MNKSYELETNQKNTPESVIDSKSTWAAPKLSLLSSQDTNGGFTNAFAEATTPAAS